VRTIEEIKARCDIVPHDDNPAKEHWIWKGAIRRQGTGIPVCSAPDYNLDPTGRKTSVMNVRRAIRFIQTGKRIKKGVESHGMCTVPLCVSPDCTSHCTRAVFARHGEETGRFKGDLRKKMASLRRWEGRRKLTEEIREKIIRDPRPATKLGPELGLHKSTVTWVRRGLFVGTKAAVFAGLLR
jgi:hypothetical protein